MTLAFCIDENLPRDLAEPLARVHRRHRFRHVRDIGAQGMDDVDLFDYLATCNFDGLITLDLRQYVDEDELDALKRSGLTWLGVPTLGARGTELLALQTAITVPGVGHVVERWNDGPAAYFLAGPGRQHDFVREVVML